MRLYANSIRVHLHFGSVGYDERRLDDEEDGDDDSLPRGGTERDFGSRVIW